MTPKEQKTRLAELGERMKKAKGKELDEITAEVDRIIGFDAGDDEYEANKERIGAWEKGRRG